MRKSIENAPIGQAVLIFFAALIIVSLLAWLFSPILGPLLVSFILYALLESVSTKLIRRGFSKSSAILLIILCVIALIFLLVSVLLPALWEQLVYFQGQWPVISERILQAGQHLDIWLKTSAGMEMQSEQIIRQWLSSKQALDSNTVVSSASIVLEFGMLIVLIPLITFFLLRDYRSARNQFIGLLPNRWFELGWTIYYKVTKQLQRYVRGLVTQSSIIAIVASVGFSLIGLEMAIVFGCLVGLLNIIPYIGPLIAAALPIGYLLSSGGLDLWLMAGVVSVVFFVQLVDNIVIIPSVIANTVGLHPLVVLFGVIIFGAAFGMPGMLIAIPILAASKIMLTSLVEGLDHRVKQGNELSM